MKGERTDRIGSMSNSSPPDDVDPPVEDRRAKARQGRERRRAARVVLSDEMKAAARSRARGTCECSNQNCWHFHQCKAPGVAYLAKRSATGVLSCVLFCRECARTSGGREERL
jgi:hypothetical protein